jgi:hypothetical protein
MHLSFSEAKLEQAIIELLQDQGYQHLIGDDVPRSSLDQVIIEDDLRHYLAARYQADGITEEEIQRLIKQFTTLPASDLYESNKTFCAWRTVSCLNATIASRKISISNCSIPGICPPHYVNCSIPKRFRCNRPRKRRQSILSSR